MEFTLMQYPPAPLLTIVEMEQVELEALAALPRPRLIRQVAYELLLLPPPPRLIRQVAEDIDFRTQLDQV